MQIFRDLLPWLNLVPFLPTVIAAPSSNSTRTEPASITKSVPDCAASPTEFSDLRFQFWIETIFLEPFTGFEFSPSNPVTIFTDFRGDDFSGPPITYDKAVVSTRLDTQLFTLSFSTLLAPDGSPLEIWPLSSDEFPGYNPIGWNVQTYPLGLFNYYPQIKAVKNCTSTNETELILRASRFIDDSERTYFSRFEPFVHLWKNKRVMRSRSLPKSKSMEQDHRKKACQS